MVVTARSGEPVVEAAEAVDVTADVIHAEMIVEVVEDVVTAEVAIAPFGWTNMAHQLARITVLLLRTFQAE
jgi:hypothetical protein